MGTKAAAGNSVIAGFFLASANSAITLESVDITGTQGTVGSAIYVQINCELDATDVTLKNIGNESSGPVVKGESALKLKFTDSTFDNNYN